MWSWRARETDPAGRPEGPRPCPACVEEVAHCHATLVLHADGVLDCAEAVCGADPSLHAWWVPCVELATPCGCVGDDAPRELEGRAA